MSIRETVRNRPLVVLVVVTLLVMGAIASAVLTFRTSSSLSGQHLAYFTNDDGKTFYPDSSQLVPPYVKDGKEAVRCMVFKCPKGEVVGYLLRYKKDAAARIAESRAQKPDQPVLDMLQGGSMTATLIETKKPGEKEWTRLNPMLMQQLTRFSCPDASQGLLVNP